MGLIVTKNIVTPEGYNVSGMYIRVTPTLSLMGESIRVQCAEYASKQAFSAGKLPIVTSFYPERTVPYDAVADGVDTLHVACSKLKSDMLAAFPELTDTDIVVE